MALLVLDMIWLKERCPPINVVVIIIIIWVHCIQGELIAQRYPTLTPHWTTCLGQFNRFTGERTASVNIHVGQVDSHLQPSLWGSLLLLDTQKKALLITDLQLFRFYILFGPSEGSWWWTLFTMDWWSRFNFNIPGLHFTVRDPTLSASHSGMTRQHLATILRAEPLDYEASEHVVVWCATWALFRSVRRYTKDWIENSSTEMLL